MPNDKKFAQLIDNLLQQIHLITVNNNLKISIAESCTGGLLASYITSIDGSSNYFEYGFITYSNQAKIQMLGVDAKIIEEFGAVSRETAKAMAAGAIKKSGSDIAVSITGVAGPTGGSTLKPVGTVWIGISLNAKKQRSVAPPSSLETSSFIAKDLLTSATEAYCFNFEGSRVDIRFQSCKKALEIITEKLSVHF